MHQRWDHPLLGPVKSQKFSRCLPTQSMYVSAPHPLHTLNQHMEETKNVFWSLH